MHAAEPAKLHVHLKCPEIQRFTMNHLKHREQSGVWSSGIFWFMAPINLSYPLPPSPRRCPHRFRPCRDQYRRVSTLPWIAPQRSPWILDKRATRAWTKHDTASKQRLWISLELLDFSTARRIPEPSVHIRQRHTSWFYRSTKQKEQVLHSCSATW